VRAPGLVDASDWMVTDGAAIVHEVVNHERRAGCSIRKAMGARSPQSSANENARSSSNESRGVASATA
jgi:hypothetical protein